VTSGEELYVSLDVQGNLAASGIWAFPDSHVYPTGQAATVAPGGGQSFPRAVALDTLDVEGVQQRVFLVVGDSISEGYIEGSADKPDDFRNSWPAVAQDALGLPIVNAAVSSQGVSDELANLSLEVLPVEGVTDCIVLLGTNQLGNTAPADIESQLATLFQQLAPRCQVWASPLLPKDTFRGVDENQTLADRAQVNAWIQQALPASRIIRLDTVLADPNDPAHFVAGMSVDGIHPSIPGQHALGIAAAQKLASVHLNQVNPGTGATSGGEWVELEGDGFGDGFGVRFGDEPATDVKVVDLTHLRARTPAHTVGPVDVQVQAPGGEHALLPGGFAFVQPQPAQGTPPASSERKGCGHESILPPALFGVAWLLRRRGARLRRSPKAGRKVREVEH
jgi:lysophospholipase L1-like esterase